jgi:ABC-type methionine transport system permease subunit
MAELFAGKEWQTFLQILPTIPFETWETVWSTVVATLLALVIGLPLGVCLVTGEQGGVRPLPRWLMALLNGLVNLLRSVPFLILMIIVIPLSRAIVGTSIGTVASIVPLVIASFRFDVSYKDESKVAGVFETVFVHLHNFGIVNLVHHIGFHTDSTRMSHIEGFLQCIL